ncbi:DUF2293 domain-containing protein [Brevundimonas sp. DWR2-3-1b1]|uniref:DUF2293 domain-containing protein n=1 Tax=unclassified Brevundimonas TaxID=2622653 RepID=UPI003CEF9C90
MAKSRRAKKAAQFTLERVLSHLDNKHPGLPPELRQRFGGEIADRIWQPPVSLGQAVGIVMSTYVRHEKTDYDTLMRKHNLTCDEARQVVKAEHDELLKAWSKCEIAPPVSPDVKSPDGLG